MAIEQVIGITIVSAAYGAIWYLVLRARRAIERIDANGLGRLREIKRGLDTDREKNG